jgi:hypothetical protein
LKVLVRFCDLNLTPEDKEVLKQLLVDKKLLGPGEELQVEEGRAFKGSLIGPLGILDDIHRRGLTPSFFEVEDNMRELIPQPLALIVYLQRTYPGLAVIIQTNGQYRKVGKLLLRTTQI